MKWSFSLLCISIYVLCMCIFATAVHRTKLKSVHDSKKPTEDIIVKRETETLTINYVANDTHFKENNLPSVEKEKNNTLNFSVDFNSTNALPGWMIPIKSGALQRTGFVVLGFMLVILVFFIVRSIRLHHKKSKSRKYGIITSNETEMVPLDNDDEEEEEMTLFDAQHKYSK